MSTRWRVSDGRGRTAAALVACLLALALSAWERPASAELRLWVVNGQGRASPAAQAHPSLQRTPPESAPADAGAAHRDPDALRMLVSGEGDELPSELALRSYDAKGKQLDELSALPLVLVKCPSAVTAPHCAATLPVRAALDEVDARHPLVKNRSIVAQLGGSMTVSVAQRMLVRMLVSGPSATPGGAIERYRASLRIVAVRASVRGAPPLGTSDAELRGAMQAAVDKVNALWGSCGVSFGAPEQLSLQVVDPPPSHLLSLGCGHGLPASGGVVRVIVAGQPLEVTLPAGATPRRAARRVAAALERMGFSAQLSDNPPAAGSALGSSDISVRSRGGRLQLLQPPAQGPISTDRSMTACIGSVNLEDGLQHFSDTNAMVGTLEERTLLKAFDDGDPSTIDVVLVPAFGRGGRIGESFIGADEAPLRNIVIVDRAGILSDGASFTLAHELGHVILDSPGHPDDYGRDLPTRLMDADAADPTAFGPRRLSLGECARALRQSGPKAPTQLLQPWPLSAP